MDTIDPSQFYTGLIADLYAAARSQAPDPAPYAAFISRAGEPALELGCGDGDPLLDLRAQGLDVEGLDSSADMLARCRAAARDRGLEVVLHHQPMEALDLRRTYRSIFLAGPTFNLLPDDDVACEALARIRAHLTPDGTALVPLFIPEVSPASDLGQPRRYLTADGGAMQLTVLGQHRDESQRRQVTTLRYELDAHNGTHAVEREWLLHWYTQEGFRALTKQCGLLVRAVRSPEGGPALPADTSFVFILQRS